MEKNSVFTAVYFSIFHFKLQFMKYKFLFLLLFPALLLQAQPSGNTLTGNINADAKYFVAPAQALINPSAFPEGEQAKRSPLLAGILSAVLPGAGQFYNEDYIKAGAFFVLEAAGIITSISYAQKGDDQTNTFQSFADNHWSVVRYAEWLNRHKGARIQIDANTALKPWQRIISWDSLNAAETSFSHKLEKYGKQQYYEMIGKYPQFSSGWESYGDYAGFDPANPNYNDVPPILQYYSHMRGKANDYYNISSKVVVGLYINHLLSALDAVWSAASFNKHLQVQVRYKEQNRNGFADFGPELKAQWHF